MNGLLQIKARVIEIVQKIRSLPKRNLAFILVSILGGIGSLLLYRHYFAPNPGERSAIVCAAVDLRENAIITPPLLSQKKAFPGEVPSDVVAAQDVGNIIGRTMRISLPAGAPLLWSDVNSAKETTTSLLLPHQRALTLPAPAIAPPLQVGDAVDIVGQEQIIARQIRLIAIQNKEEGLFFTFAVSSNEAIEIVTAAERGALSILLSEVRQKKKSKHTFKSIKIITGLPL